MALAEFLLVTLREPITWIALVLGLLTAYVIQFYRRVQRLPPGPTPLPFVGNLHQLRLKMPLYEKAMIWIREHGDPITVWVGERPFVIASTKESFRDISGPLRNNVAGRNPTEMGKMMSRGFEDVAFGDFTPSWNVLRKLAHVAMRKYAATERLAELVADTVDDEIEHVLGGSDEQHEDVVDFIEDIINNILAVSSFGEAFKRGDELYEKMRQANREFETSAPNGLPSDIMPILGYIYFKQERAARGAFAKFMSVTDHMFAQAKATWTPGTNRHFTDILLNAREEFLAEDRESSKYLTDNNLRQVVQEIFGAGTGTSSSILSWCCIRLAHDPELQEELRSEVLAVIGRRKCTAADRNQLPKTDSLLQEVLRYYPAGPLSIPRKALTDVTMNGRFIPKNTDLLINLYAVNKDESIWGPDVYQFKPKRFVDATEDQRTRGANTFSIGARSCPGEKLSQADMFYTLVRILQKVKLSCVNGPGTAIVEKKDSDILLDAPRQKLIFSKLVEA